MITMTYRVPYADTDQMGVVYYANYFVLFERARNELMRGMECNYRELEEQGVILPVTEAHCSYRKSAHYDDLLEITAAVTEVKGVRVKISCQVLRDGELLVEGWTVHACLNRETLRPIRVPPFVRAENTGSVPQQ